jgi:hypothetical protein
MTRKRMSDLEAALHFINSIDMNVRDEKNALVPVTTMVDRVIDILHVGVAECLERKVVCYKPPFMSFTCCKALQCPLSRQGCICFTCMRLIGVFHELSFCFLTRLCRCRTPFGFPNCFSKLATGTPSYPDSRFRCGGAPIAAC